MRDHINDWTAFVAVARERSFTRADSWQMHELRKFERTPQTARFAPVTRHHPLSLSSPFATFSRHLGPEM
jgi:hypothetical protein